MERMIQSSQNYVYLTSVSLDLVKKKHFALAEKSCNLDAIQAWLLIKSLESTVPLCLKQAHLIEKSGLDTENFANYWPVSNLSFISKLI